MGIERPLGGNRGLGGCRAGGRKRTRDDHGGGGFHLGDSPGDNPGPTPFDATPPPADPTPVAPEIMACRGWEEWFVGDFSYFNNVWNRQDTSDYEQCIMRRTVPGLVERVEYGWRWRWPTRRGQVKAYPELIYGHKPWHPRSTTPELPRRIDAIEALEVDYAAYLAVEGTYILAFDFWITRDDPPTVSGISHEVMIWLDHGFRRPDRSSMSARSGSRACCGICTTGRTGSGRMQTGTANSSPTTWTLVRHRDLLVGSLDLLALFRFPDRPGLPAGRPLPDRDRVRQRGGQRRGRTLAQGLPGPPPLTGRTRCEAGSSGLDRNLDPPAEV